MGLFSFFNKKKEDAPAPQVSEDKIEVVKVQRQRTSAAKLEGLEYARRNKNGDYWLPAIQIYKIKGTNPETGKPSRTTVEATDETTAINYAQEKGVAPPFKIISALTFEPPTEYQLNEAEGLGVIFPEGTSAPDAQAILDRIRHGDTQGVPFEFLEYLERKGWQGSTFAGYKDISRTIFAGRDYRNACVFGNLAIDIDQREMIALYAYFVTRAEAGKKLKDFDLDPDRSKCYDFADAVLGDAKMLADYNRWLKESRNISERKWAIYKDLKAFWR